MRARGYGVTSVVVSLICLLGAATGVRAADADNDGVDDALDRCCNTPIGVAVDSDGRPVGDLDLDCDTDIVDYQLFLAGFTGVIGLGDDRLCNPVAQTGCDVCEKCTFVPDLENAGESRSFCRPDGLVPVGGTCVLDQATGLDDCASGLICEAGTCAEICSLAPDSCPSGETCTELPGLVDSPGVGYCKVPCDPLTSPSGCLEGEACFIALMQETTFCGPPYETGMQGDACEYINGCVEGYSCSLHNSPVLPTGWECAFVCDASQSGGPTCADGPGASYTCVAINQFYSDLPDMPDEYGMCVDPVEWDEDGDGVLDFEDFCPGTLPGTTVDSNGCP